LAADCTFLLSCLAGDVTGDGRVDAMDYLVAKKDLGKTGLGAWSGGDVDGDGDVDAIDLLAIQGCLGGSLGSPPPADLTGGAVMQGPPRRAESDQAGTNAGDPGRSWRPVGLP
jgi:hypothetical protein